jgi:predicted ribosomally synthesized peptide with nif11-like leader
MSKESATAFLTRAQQDGEIKQKLEALGTGADVEEVLDVAAAAGYDFSASDLLAAGKASAEHRGQSGETELSDAELEMVAGGRINLTIIQVSRDTIFFTIKSTF